MFGSFFAPNVFFDEYVVKAAKVNDIIVTKADVTKLDSLYSCDYNTLFRVPTSDIVKITSKGGNYPHTDVTYLIDDNVSTHWET